MSLEPQRLSLFNPQIYLYIDIKVLKTAETKVLVFLAMILHHVLMVPWIVFPIPADHSCRSLSQFFTAQAGKNAGQNFSFDMATQIVEDLWASLMQPCWYSQIFFCVTRGPGKEICSVFPGEDVRKLWKITFYSIGALTFAVADLR